MAVFMRAQSLKTNDMFDSAAAAELEQVSDVLISI
jgi:hypothetical protein